MAENCLGYIKFSSRKWLEKLAYGELSFSCSAKFISDYQCSGDETRGDKLEAVFAHVDKKDKRIEESVNRLGRDLEIIDDNDRIYLRRRSSCLVPIYCLFGITDELVDAEEIDSHNVKFTFDFPEEMYKGFSDNEANCSLFIQAKSFEREFEVTTHMLGIQAKKQFVKYLDKENELFFIEPTDEREELFIKSTSYSNQNEYRITLPSIRLQNAFERMPIHLCDINYSDRYIFPYRVSIKFWGKR